MGRSEASKQPEQQQAAEQQQPEQQQAAEQQHLEQQQPEQQQPEQQQAAEQQQLEQQQPEQQQPVQQHPPEPQSSEQQSPEQQSPEQCLPEKQPADGDTTQDPTRLDRHFFSPVIQNICDPHIFKNVRVRSLFELSGSATMKFKNSIWSLLRT